MGLFTYFLTIDSIDLITVSFYVLVGLLLLRLLRLIEPYL